MEPFQVKLQVVAELSKVKARPRVYSPAKTAWLDEQFAQLADAGMVYVNPQAMCSNPAQAVPKGNGSRSTIRGGGGGDVAHLSPFGEGTARK